MYSMMLFAVCMFLAVWHRRLSLKMPSYLNYDVKDVYLFHFILINEIQLQKWGAIPASYTTEAMSMLQVKIE